MKILLLDIETSPNIGAFWGLFKQNISHNHVTKVGRTLCWAAKWHNESKVYFASTHHDGHEDMVEKMWLLLDEADVVVHYNGKKFDMPTLNREFLLQELVPPSPYKQVDLYSTVRSNFRFVSNKLDFVCQQLGLGAKTQHKGMDLWFGCMEGKREDWKVMKEYNIQDVALLEDLYVELLPWVRAHPSHGVYTNAERPTCRNCGSEHVHKKGVEHTTTTSYQRYKCADCGTNMRGRKALAKVGAGVLV